jgi:single-stranded-DNA-specific exonuclease
VILFWVCGDGRSGPLKMPYKWANYKNSNLNPELLDFCDGDTLVARLLTNRSVTTVKEAKFFLDYQNIDLVNALEIPDMSKAFARIIEAISSKQKILIYGDYDVDGTTSIALLYRTFQIIGFPVTYYVPNRHVEGYGLNRDAIAKLKTENQIDLLITCDCGISNFAEVEFANLIGLDVIITDHHSIPPIPPNSIANCNPKTLSHDHPLHYLPGVGVAYKLAELLLDHYLGQDAFAYKISLLDLVALGIIADLAALKGENRYLAYLGLKELSKSAKSGIIELLKVSGVKLELNTEHVGFSLAPRINAAGRLADAARAVELMITDDALKASALAKELDEENRSRQELCRQIYDEAIEQIDQNMLDSKVIVLAGHWNHGVIGIVASRVLEKFNLPVFIMSIESEIAKGSVRSINIADLDIYEEMFLLQSQSNIFLKFGGHKMAAGFSIEKDKLQEFKNLVEHHFKNKFAQIDLTKTIYVDSAIRLSEINDKLMSRIAKLAPYGIENPLPVFVSSPLKIKNIRFMGEEQKHLKLWLEEANNPKVYEAVLWNKAQDFTNDFGYDPRDKELALAFSLRHNDYQGEKSIQLDVRDWQLATYQNDELFLRIRSLRSSKMPSVSK